MAEVVGVISAGAGIASFLIQVTSGIESLRRAIKYNRHEAVGHLEFLSADLETLQKLVSGLQNSRDNPLVGVIIRHCQQTWDEFDIVLNKLLQVFGDEKSQGTRRNPLRKIGMLSLNAEDDIKDLRGKVSSIIKMLI